MLPAPPLDRPRFTPGQLARLDSDNGPKVSIIGHSAATGYVKVRTCKTGITFQTTTVRLHPA